MAESGIDLSYDESRPAKMSISTGSGGIRVIGTKSPSTNISASMAQPRSLRQVRLRSSQRLQLMKMQMEAETKRSSSSSTGAGQGIPLTVSASSLPATTGHSFLGGAFQAHSGSLLVGSHSSGSVIPDLHDYAVRSYYNQTSTMDEEELLSDISGVLEDDLSSCGSFNVPSIANSCFAELTTEKQEAEEEDKTSSSCPLIPLHPSTLIQPYRGGRKKEPPPPFPNEESKIMWLKVREKKDQHNNIEKKRRSKINDYIHELATLLPESYDIDLQNKKGNILEASVDYIRKLQTDEKRLHQMRKQQEELEKANRRLQLQIQLLQMNIGSQMAPQGHPHPTTNPQELMMPGPMLSELISPHHHHQHQQQLTTEAQLLQTDPNLHMVNQNLMADPNLFAAEGQGHDLDLMSGDLFHGDLGIDNVDPIFSDLHIVAPRSTGDHQIPLVVEEYMDLQ